MSTARETIQLAALVIAAFSAALAPQARAEAQQRTTPGVCDSLLEKAKAAMKKKDYERVVQLNNERLKTCPGALPHFHAGVALGTLAAAVGVDDTRRPKYRQQAMMHFRHAVAHDQRPLSADDLSVAVEWMKALRRELAGYKLQIEPAEAVVLVDGAVPELDPEGVAWLVPGKRSLTVTASGYRTYQASFVARAGSEEPLEVTLEPERADTPPDAPQAGQQATDDDGSAVSASVGSDDGAGAPVGAFIVGGIGAALLVGSAITGVVAKNKADELDEMCLDGLCPSTAQPTYDDAKTLATVTDVLLFSGIAGVGVGLVWFIVASSDAESSEGSAQLQPLLSPNHAGVQMSATF